MKMIIRDGERRIMLDTDKDVLVWSGRKNHAGQNSPNRWTDLFAHRSAGGISFYMAHYTCWQGESNNIAPLDLDEAQRFAEEHYDQLELADDELKELCLIDLDGVE